MNAADVRFEVLGPGDARHPLLRRTFDVVLRPSFETDELPGWDFLEAGFLDDADQTAVVAVDGEDPLGVAVFDAPTAGGIALLSYLAVRPGLRSRGVGAALLGRARDVWAEGGLALALGEVHDPRVHASTDREQPEARLSFYERNGSELIWLPWLQPALASVSERVDGMLLLAFHRSGWAAGPDLDAAPLREWMQLYYLGCEGGVPDDGPYRALAARFALERVPVRPIADYPELALLASE